MNPDTELDSWRGQWQVDSNGSEAGNAAAELRRQSLRRTRLQSIGLIVPVVVTVLIGGGVAPRAISSQSAIDIAIAIESWLFILVTWAGCLWIARGTWQPLGESTTDFLRLSIRRYQANLRAIPFANVLYFSQLIAVYLILVRYSGEAIELSELEWRVWVVVVVGMPAISLWGFGLRLYSAGGCEACRSYRASSGSLD